ncbi:DUF3299 domain-containing protein [Hydrogenovibrio halophilus]|uniref:DUF3299 domain-containing protein n=1 Tax=Hydrogenovibrio halophilus TaxID=373391 RepID=UPI000377CC78|nr:DUF3299 domain-containing protein [Hydrogenovibrio halophilus]
MTTFHPNQSHRTGPAHLTWVRLGLLVLLWPLLALGQDTPRTLYWQDLIPDSHHPDKVLAKYEEEINYLNTLPDGSEEGLEIVEMIQKELDNLPVNPELDGQTVTLAGYIAPLEIRNGLVHSFLLVPYFGACIHVPAPPPNQTVYVTTAEGEALRLDDIDYAFKMTGTLALQEKNTELGDSGYHLQNARGKIHKDEVWLEPEAP